MKLPDREPDQTDPAINTTNENEDGADEEMVDDEEAQPMGPPTEANAKEAPPAKQKSDDNEDEKSWLDRTTTNRKGKSWKSDIDNDDNKFKKFNARRKLFIAGGVGGIVVACLFALFSFLLPFRLTHIIETIEQRVGQVPAHAVDRRLEYYMNRYLIIKALEESGSSRADLEREYTFLGDSYWGTMYTNWNGAKIEGKMDAKLVPKGVGGGSRARMRPSSWNLVDKKSGSMIGGLNSREARQVIKNMTDKELHPGGVLKRHHDRLILKKFYGIPKWKPFEKTFEDVRERYLNYKNKWKKTVVQNSVGLMSEKYGLYFECLADSGSGGCTKKLRDGEYDTNKTDKLIDNSQLDDVVDEATDAASSVGGKEAEERIGARIFAQIQELGLKKIMASVVSGVGAIATFSHIVNALDSGVLNQIIYARNAQQYVGFAAPYLSGNDQIRAAKGDYDTEQVRIINQSLDGFEKSPVYQAGKMSEERTWAVDCDGDGQKENLEKGETVCPEKRLIQDKTSFTKSKTWKEVIVPINKMVGNPVREVVDKFSNITTAVLDRVGVNSAMEKMLDALGVNKALLAGFKSILNRIAGAAVSGGEHGSQAFEALYAGMTVKQSSLGGAVGTASGETIRGQLLTDEQVAEIKKDNFQDRQNQLRSMPVFARYFSPDVAESLTGQLALAMPVSVGSFSSRVSSLLNPVNLFGRIGSLFTARSHAATATKNVNPFHSLYFGYPDDHPINTANGGEGMDPEELRQRYQCDKPAEERPQNRHERAPDRQIPFRVIDEADPCQLETIVQEVGTMIFTGNLDEGIDEPTPSGGGTGSAIGGALPTAPVDASQIEDIPPWLGVGRGCHKNIAANVRSMLQAADADGVHLTGSCWRSTETQISLRISHGCGGSRIYDSSCKGSPPTAVPGRSNHEKGLAIDFSNCSSHGTACWRWLSQHAAQYGMQNLPSEPWHWSVDGR